MDNLINHFSVKTAKDFFFKKFDTFSEDSEDYSDLLKDERFSNLEKIGEASFDNGDDMLIFTCKSLALLTDRSSKKSQYEIAKLMMNNERKDSAIAIFYDAIGNFRFSLIRRNHGNKEQKFSPYKRFTYFVTKEQTNKTFRIRIDSADFSSLDKIQEAFNVDKLTKQFYEELFNWYLWALSEEDGFSVKYPNDTATEEDNRRIEEHLIRLITRLIFVWFIRRKKLIPDEIFNTEELEKILVAFNPESKTEGNYYNAILQNLFFACLNNPIEDRKFSTEDSFNGVAVDYGVKNLFRDNKKKSWFKISKDEVVDIFKNVPFLNGGLFECLDKITENNKMLYYDGFSRDEKTKDGTLKRAFVPNALFFDKNKGLITILERYNFTVEENSVDDVEVALDPELLGKVFENLLAAYNPETKETARKQTGSFYTPREIVDFMVDQSLIQYLATHNPDINKEDFEKFILKKEIPESFTHKKSEEISSQIKNIKILDPACGSGAYPMGILTRLYELLTLLSGSSDNNYENKLTLIENCIYGVDIQSIAVQISKLRFFISLIVEQTPNSDIKENYGIKSLPNLETKFVAANTLIGLKQNSKDQLDLNDDELLKMKEELWDIRNHQNFRARSFKEKKELRKKDKELCDKIKKYIHKTAGGPNQAKINQNLEEISKAEEKLKKLPVIMVDVTESFTQTSIFEDNTPKTPSMFSKDANEEERNKLKKSIAALKKEIELEKNKKGNIDTEEADNLISWDPYDQNASSPFFDPEWMFGLEKFDIVIGNPPYISTKGIDLNFKKRLEEQYNFSDDTYSHFFFKGTSLVKNNGVVSYIIPKTFWTTQTKKNLRDLILGNHINYIYDTANPFESAMVDTCVISVSKTSKLNHSLVFLDGSKDLQKPIIYHVDQDVYLNTQNSVIFKPTAYNLRIYDLYGVRVKELYEKWWDKISTSKNIEKNKTELEKYRNSLKPGDITLLGCLTEGGQGLATANNGKYIAVRKSSKWAKGIIESRPKKLAEALKKYKINLQQMSGFLNTVDFLNSLSEKEIENLFDNLKEKYGRDIFGQGYIFRLVEDEDIADVDSLSDDEKENGIDSSKKFYVPYDKGDKDGNRWYLETPFAIAWTKENVGFLKTNSGKKGEGMPVVRNPQYYFKEGFCWTNILNPNARLLKVKLKMKSVNDVGSMSLISVNKQIPNSYFVCLLNSNFLFDYYRDFVNNTVNIQINDIRQLPVVIPSDESINYIENYYKQIIIAKKKNDKNELILLENEIDKHISKLFKVV